MEMSLIERSRVKARNVNNNERARCLTQDMTPLREKKRKLEDDLLFYRKRKPNHLGKRKREMNQRLSM